MDNSFKITLEPIMDLSNITSLHEVCQAALDDSALTVEIDASQVERLKTPLFQLIIIFKYTLKSIDKKLVIDKPSKAFEEMAKCLGAWEVLQKNF